MSPLHVIASLICAANFVLAIAARDYMLAAAWATAFCFALDGVTS